MSTSVIIRCRNEERWIGHAIQSVLDHLKDPQIIVIDNCSTDDSKDVVRMFQTFCNVSCVDIDRYSPGKALNQSLLICKHDNVLILSSHCVIYQYDDDMISRYLENEYVAIFGDQIPVYRGKKLLKR